MKQSHKLQQFGDVDAVVASAPSLSEAAKRLGVNRSTLHRWLQAGKVKRPGLPRSLPPPEPVVIPSPADAVMWAATVKAAFTLSETDLTLLDLAGRALAVAHNAELHAMTRLSAMGRFQALVKQLELSDAKRIGAVEPEKPARVAAVRRAGGDPRAFLMAIK